MDRWNGKIRTHLLGGRPGRMIIEMVRICKTAAGKEARVSIRIRGLCGCYKTDNHLKRGESGKTKSRARSANRVQAQPGGKH